MTASLTIPIVRDPQYRAGDRVEVEVDGQLQPDSVYLWGTNREKMGEGYGTEEQTGEGFGRWPAYGEGMEGYGWHGSGAGVLEHQTVRHFPAGDYQVRLRAVDELGNVGPWSEPSIIYHRPSPPAPSNVRVEEGKLKWDWSET